MRFSEIIARVYRDVFTHSGSVADIQEKLAILRLDTALAERIARSGQALAIERFSFAAVGQSIVEAMRPVLREPERPGWLEKTWRRIFT